MPVHHAVLLQLSQRSRRELDPKVPREGGQQVQAGQPPAHVHAGPRLLLVQLHPPHRPERAQEEPQPGLRLRVCVFVTLRYVPCFEVDGRLGTGGRPHEGKRHVLSHIMRMYLVLQK